MGKKKRTPFTERLRYIPGWIRRPGLLLGLTGWMGLAVFTIMAAFPCGKSGGGPAQGVCVSGASMNTFFECVAWALAITGISTIIIMLQTPNDADVKATGIFRKFVRDMMHQTPQWRKRWFPAAFLASYVPLAAGNYLLFKDGGLYLYSHVAQYGILLPAFAAGIASFILTMGRQVVREQQAYKRFKRKAKK